MLKIFMGETLRYVEFMVKYLRIFIKQCVGTSVCLYLHIGHKSGTMLTSGECSPRQIVHGHLLTTSL